MCRSRFRRASNWSKHLLELPTWKEGTSPFRGKDLFHANDADSRAAFAAKQHTHTHDDRESATGRSRRTSRPLARVPRLARAVAWTWRPRRETRRTSRTKTRATTAEPNNLRLEAARVASRRTRACATRRRRRTMRRTRSPTKMTTRDRYGAPLARRDTTRSRTLGCCFLFATFNAAFPGAVRFAEGDRGASRRRASWNAPRRRSTAALARTRRDLRRPSRRFAWTSARSMPGRADNRTSRGFFASILLILALDWPARDRGEDIFTAIFSVSPRRSVQQTKSLVPSARVLDLTVFPSFLFARSFGASRRPNDRACVWTASPSRASAATSAGAAK